MDAMDEQRAQLQGPTVEPTTEPTAEPTNGRPPRRRRKRTGRKRTVFQPPERPAVSVRELWRQASQEERQRAHELGMRMLEYWLGKKTREELAGELGLPGVRVYQLSQQAVSGMLAGLLKQPRRRGRVCAQVEPTPGADPAALKKRVRELEVQLSRTEDLVRVLRTAPWAKQVAEPSKDAPAGRRKARASKKRRAAGRPKAIRPRDPAQDRSAAPQSAARPGGAGDAG